MKITRREFLKTALVSAGSLLQPTLPGRLNRNQDAPNVIVLVFDSLSARHLSLLGYPRLTTTNLEKFAETATVYHRHYSAGNFTSPGAASLFTGTYPWTHRAFQQSGLIARELCGQNLFRLVDDSYQKVAFAQNVWADLFLQQFHTSIDIHLKSTAFSIENELHYNGPLGQTDSLATFRAYDDFLEQDYGLPGSLYFSLFDKLKTYTEKEIRFSGLAEEYPRGIPNFAKYKLYFLLEDVFNGVRDEIVGLQKPFVGYFHFWTPHSPYAPNREFVGLFNDNWAPPAKPFHPLDGCASEEHLRQLRREYDEYVANLDAEFGRFYQSLKDAGVLENSYIIVTSDHGELLSAEYTDM
jgi:membrane-anchored protein YejM (alkaline phosphatase superfamily)